MSNDLNINRTEDIKDPRKAIRVGTIFISSRMGELAMERRSAYSAIVEARLTPILFETEPHKDDREKIDALVDRADIFLGIYYQTMGSPAPSLFKLCPIEYELYRFLARFDICERPEACQLTDPARRAISEKMDNREYLRDLKRRLGKENSERSGRLFSIMNERVLLYMKVHRPDNNVSRKLLEFLEGMRRVRFRNRSIDPSYTLKMFMSEKRYIPAHLDLFGKIFQRLTKAQSGGTIVASQPVGGSFFECRIKGKDQPGLLYKILDVCLFEYFNIKSLLIRKDDYSDPASGAIEVALAAEPFFTHPTHNQARENVARLDDAVRFRIGREHNITVKAVESWTDFIDESTVVPQLPSFYGISTADVPGIIMAVTRLVSHLDGSVEFVYFGKKGVPKESQYFYLIIGVAPLGADSPISTELGLRGLEYELQSIMGVGLVTMLSRRTVVDRLGLSETSPV